MTPEPAEILDTGNDPKNSRKKITCEFCGCILLPSGEHTELSEKAKKLRGLESENEKLSGEIERLTQELADVKKLLSERPAAPAKKKSYFQK